MTRPHKIPNRPSMRTKDVVYARPEDYGYSRWRLRMWHGMSTGAWFGLLRGNIGKVSPQRIGLLITVTIISFGNLFLKMLSRLIYGRRIDRTEFAGDPIFVLGHWRSGTTFLHQLIMSNPRYASPTALQVFTPETFPVLQVVMRPLFRLFVPKSRPMDRVELQKTSAEEDEIALLLSGAPSPYRGLAFPMDNVSGDFTNVDRFTKAELRSFRTKWLGFLRAVQFFNPGRQLVLKSPAHTKRIPEILHHFPNAKFVCIVRDPYTVTLSGLKTSIALPATQALQTYFPSEAFRFETGLEEYMKFQRQLWATEGMVPEGNMITIKYEDLMADKIGVMRQVYEALDLGEFSDAEPFLQGFVKDRKGYVKNSYDMKDEVEERIWTVTREAFEHYGYQRLGERKEAAE